MLKVMVSGCNGKMGKEVINEISCNNEFCIISGFDLKNASNTSYPIYNNINEITQAPHVIIDFSFPICTLEILKYATANKIPLVIATTGFSKNQLDKIYLASKQIPIFFSSNMSFDITIMQNIVAEIAKILPNTDIEIIETHHKNKVDAPSGTALSLANSIASALPYKPFYTWNRGDIRKKRSNHEIGFSSIRGGNIVGEHTVKFFGEHETFSITHTAYSRTIFAQGALKAAKFIVKQGAGLYNMENLV